MSSDQSALTKEFSLSAQELLDKAIENGEGIIASNGALSVETGERTGRSPNDRFIVKEAGTKNLIDWGEINKPFEEEKFNALWNNLPPEWKGKSSSSADFIFDQRSRLDQKTIV